MNNKSNALENKQCGPMFENMKPILMYSKFSLDKRIPFITACFGVTLTLPPLSEYLFKLDSHGILFFHS